MAKIKVHSCNNEGQCVKLKNGDYECNLGDKSAILGKSELKKISDIFLAEDPFLYNGESGLVIFQLNKHKASREIISIRKTYCKAQNPDDLLDQLIERYISNHNNVSEAQIKAKLSQFTPEVRILIMKRKLLEVWIEKTPKAAANELGLSAIDVASPTAWTTFMKKIDLDETLLPLALDQRILFIISRVPHMLSNQRVLASIFFKYLSSDPKKKDNYKTPEDVINKISNFSLPMRIKILQSELIKIWANKLGYQIDPKSPDAYLKFVNMISDPSGDEVIQLYGQPDMIDKRVNELVALKNPAPKSQLKTLSEGDIKTRLDIKPVKTETGDEIKTVHIESLDGLKDRKVQKAYGILMGPEEIRAEVDERLVPAIAIAVKDFPSLLHLYRQLYRLNFERKKYNLHISPHLYGSGGKDMASQALESANKMTIELTETELKKYGDFADKSFDYFNLPEGAKNVNYNPNTRSTQLVKNEDINKGYFLLITTEKIKDKLNRFHTIIMEKLGYTMSVDYGSI